MKSKIKTKIGVIVACAAMALSCVGFATYAIVDNHSFTASAAEFVEPVGGLFKTQYQAGEMLEIPQTVEVQVNESVTQNGTFKAIQFPSGGATTQTEVTLNEVGEYTVIYEYGSKNKKTITKTFQVVNTAYTIGEKTNVTFGSVSNYIGAKGYTIQLANGEVFRYNEPINVYDDDIASILNFYPEQIVSKYETNTIDAESIIVTITDCYDPSIKIDMLMWFAPDAGSGIYCRTRSSQGDIGLYVGSTGVIIDGTPYGLWKGSWGRSVSGQFGSGAGTNTDGSHRDATFSAKGAIWRYEDSTKRVNLATVSNGNSTIAREEVVNDLDNKDIATATFDGFTTGEVFVSISAENWFADYTTIRVSDIGHKSGDELEVYQDNVAPDVRIDTRNMSGTIYAQKGREFPLFDATAYDVNLMGNVKANVYYNYDNAMKSAVAVKDGKFVPTQAGVYTVEYSGKDSFGNIGRATVDVIAVDEAITELTVEEVEGGKVGKPIVLPQHTMRSYDKAEDLSLTIKFVDAKGVETLVDPNSRAFIPTAVGTGKVVYEYADRLFTYIRAYNVEIAANEHPGFMEFPEVEEFYLKGVSYAIKELTAYNFTGTTPTPVATTVYVKFDGGEYVPVEDLNALVITGSSTVQFKYVAGETEWETEVVEIKDVGYDTSAIRIQDYFTGNFTKEAKGSKITFTSNITTGDNTLAFIQPLAYEVFTMTYAIPQDYANFNSYSIILEDEYGVRVTINHRNDESGALRAYINGSTSGVSIGGALLDTYDRKVSYNAQDRAFEFSSRAAGVKVPFECGFLGRTVKMSFVFEGIYAPSAVEVKWIMNQAISNVKADFTMPVVYADAPKSFVEQGQEVVINAGVACDVLSIVKEKDFTMSVKAPDGTFVTSKDGVLLQDVSPAREYVIVLEQGGQYAVSYIAADSKGNAMSKAQTYYIESADIVSPVITFNDGSTAETVQTMKLFYRYNVKQYTITDNNAVSELTTHVIVYRGNYQVVAYDPASLLFTEEGNYFVYVYSVDRSGNYAYNSYQINVVAEAE